MDWPKVGGMDALDSLLDGSRARGAFLLRALLDPPWSLRVQDEAPLTIVAMLRGEAWVLSDGEAAARLGASEVAIMRGPDHYTVADSPDRPTTAVIRSGGRATTISGEELCAEMTLGVRTWGNSPDGATAMLIGTYEVQSEVSQRLLRALPAMLVLSDEARACPLLPLLAAEVGRDAPGQEVVLDRMLDLLVIDLLRRWFAQPDSTAPAWYHADGDPIVGPALRLLHNNPAHPWTVAELARHAGISRAALAKRFTSLVGEPPMSYLSTWRLTLAADLMREHDNTLSAVARKVGYSSAFALSTAFKRVRGMSPHEYRQHAQVG